jgi:uncharacterized protein YkwD
MFWRKFSKFGLNRGVVVGLVVAGLVGGLWAGAARRTPEQRLAVRATATPVWPKTAVLSATTPGPTVGPSPSPTVAATALPGDGVAPAASPPAPTELAAEAVCPGQQDVARAAAALVCLAAEARKFHGLSTVAASDGLMTAAGAKTQDMVACGYGHTACGRAFDYWMSASGFTGNCTAENIAQGQQTPRAVFEAWMKSAGHRENILNPDYRFIGIGTAGSGGGRDWVMELGGC